MVEVIISTLYLPQSQETGSHRDTAPAPADSHCTGASSPSGSPLVSFPSPPPLRIKMVTSDVTPRSHTQNSCHPWKSHSGTRCHPSRSHCVMGRLRPVAETLPTFSASTVLMSPLVYLSFCDYKKPIMAHGTGGTLSLHPKLWALISGPKSTRFLTEVATVFVLRFLVSELQKFLEKRLSAPSWPLYKHRCLCVHLCLGMCIHG